MRSFIGKVVSDRMQKSVVVAVDRLFQHPKYPRTVKRTKKFMAHDEENACGIGDTVKIEATRPLSRRKKWNVLEIIRKEKAYSRTPPTQSST